jgi:hypothetical protein
MTTAGRKAHRAGDKAAAAATPRRPAVNKMSREGDVAVLRRTVFTRRREMVKGGGGLGSG